MAVIRAELEGLLNEDIVLRLHAADAEELVAGTLISIKEDSLVLRVDTLYPLHRTRGYVAASRGSRRRSELRRIEYAMIAAYEGR